VRRSREGTLPDRSTAPAEAIQKGSIGQLFPNMTRNAPTPFIQLTKSGGSLCKT
jgi:hypothetical protein